MTVFKKNSEKGRNVKLQAFPATQSSLPVTSGWGPGFPNSFPGVLWPRRLALNESSPSWTLPTGCWTTGGRRTHWQSPRWADASAAGWDWSSPPPNGAPPAFSVLPAVSALLAVSVPPAVAVPPALFDLLRCHMGCAAPGSEPGGRKQSVSRTELIQTKLWNLCWAA